MKIFGLEIDADLRAENLSRNLSEPKPRIYAELKPKIPEKEPKGET